MTDMSPSAEPQALSSMPLPTGFTCASDILDEKTRPGVIVNLIALVKDCRLPIPTSGTDHKSTLRLYDLSTETREHDVVLNIFRPLDEMPDVGPGDVLVIFYAKAQRYQSNPLSLITNWRSIMRVYEADKISRPPKSAKLAMKSPKGKGVRQIDDQTEEYISWMYHTIDKSHVPGAEEFKVASVLSLNVKNKFSLLQDIRQDRFYDLVVRAAKEPFDLGDKMTLWVTDYTENSAFFHMEYDGAGPQDSQEGDPYGYTRIKGRKSVSTPEGFNGPFGKRCLQITCYEPHATAIREHVDKNSWVSLRNVQVKFGANANNLEGFLREDRGAGGAKIQVDVLDPMDDPENVSPRLKDAIGRKRDYEKQRKAQLKNFNALSQGKKRKPSDQPENKPLNAKARRNLKRASLQKKEQEEEKQHGEASLELNKSVKCENAEQPSTTVTRLLERPTYSTTGPHGEGLDIQLPFICAKFRINARVVDFFPPKLEDFASSRSRSEYDVLDEGNDSDFDSEDSDGGMNGTPESSMGHRIWEWRFALRLEDASPLPPGKGPAAAQETFWVVVDNADAQLLTGLDAVDLRRDANTLSSLRETMFTLWGNLEEIRAAAGVEKEKSQGAVSQPKLTDRPMDSSDEESTIKTSRAKMADQGATVSNRPFSCCVRQYGIKVKESDELRADAGKNQRWERVYGLFGTKISSC